MEPKPQKKLTPVMQQHHVAKTAHPDAILFFRMGDFYEMFHDDAVICARLLDLALTSRNKEDPTEPPMAGVPVHAAHGYIARLLAAGHKVAICEQMADPSKCKGIVPRQVVRVITPGLVTDTDQLDARTNHWLLAVDQTETSGIGSGSGAADLSTGELAAGTMSDLASILAELARCDPREVLWGAPIDPVVRSGISLAAPRAVLREDEPLADADIVSSIDAAVAEPLAAEAATRLSRSAMRAAARVLRFARKCMPGGNLRCGELRCMNRRRRCVSMKRRSYISKFCAASKVREKERCSIRWMRPLRRLGRGFCGGVSSRRFSMSPRFGGASMKRRRS